MCGVTLLAQTDSSPSFRDAPGVAGVHRPSGSLAALLLTSGVPLTLLLDLMEASGPDSAAIYDAERRGVPYPEVALPTMRPWLDRTGTQS